MSAARIGLLGGAFNPAHDGHVYISQQAQKLLGLDEIWWLVAADHPTKSGQDNRPFSERFSKAEEFTASCDYIRISNFEKEQGTSYTFNTVAALKRVYPDNKFVWLIGSDNFINLHKWHRWQDLCQQIPFAVFNREPYSDNVFSCEAADYYGDRRVPDCKVQDIVAAGPPSWCFINIDPNPISSTELREKG